MVYSDSGSERFKKFFYMAHRKFGQNEISKDLGFNKPVVLSEGGQKILRMVFFRDFSCIEESLAEGRWFKPCILKKRNNSESSYELTAEDVLY